MSIVPDPSPKPCQVIIACSVMEAELEQARKDHDMVEIRYLEQALHRTPQKMPEILQENIDYVAGYAGRIILGYGLCSNGILGVRARTQPLLIPRCHDCIALFLGSSRAYDGAFNARPGTYYLTPGWLKAKKDPLGIVEEEYTPRLGRDTALWVMEEELKHYTHIVLVNNGVGDLEVMRERARENASVLKKTLEEVEGNLEYFDKIVRGPYTEEDFLVIEPGREITQERFF